MADEPLSISLQENLVTVLAYNDRQGRIVANSLDTKLMDGDYRTVAEACIKYWKEYSKPPMDHTGDLLAHVVEDKGNRRSKAVTRILRGMAQLADSGLNTEYVLKQIQTHQRTQSIKAAVLESAELLNTQQHLALPEVEELWQNLLAKGRSAETFAPGLRLDNPGAIISRLNQFADEFNNGVAMLDQRWVVPSRKELFIWLGASGRGKTWALIRQGVAALRRRKKVLHVTLENGEDRTAQRYYQTLFQITRRKTPVELVRFDIERGKFRGIEFEDYKPRFAMDYANAGVRLTDAMRGYKGMYRNLIIKEFPPHELTINGLNAYLDMLEHVEGFVPDLLIVDYAGIMKVDPKNQRDSMSANVLGLRGICVTRSMAGVTAHQSNREGAKARMITAMHVAEAWPVVHHADSIVTFSSSDFEFRMGLCRAFVAKCRNEEDKFAFLMTQNYRIGQFCLDSRHIDLKYFDVVKELEEERGDELQDGGYHEVEEEDREAA